MSSPSWSVASKVPTEDVPSGYSNVFVPVITGLSSASVTVIFTMMLPLAPDGSVADSVTM